MKFVYGDVVYVKNPFYCNVKVKIILRQYSDEGIYYHVELEGRVITFYEEELYK